MKTTATIQQLFEKLIDSRRHEDEIAPPAPRIERQALTVDPAWLDHYLMHRDERTSR